MAKFLFDVGHGGSDAGACKGNRKEKDDVLRLALQVGKEMAHNGHAVEYTRTTDQTLSLSARSYMENVGKYDYFVSFHRDSFTAESANGVTVFTYLGYSGKADGKLAKNVSDSIVQATGYYNRGVREADFHVLRETKCSAILIECGFISNLNDNNVFDSKFNEIAKAIANGICKTVGCNHTSVDHNPTVPVAKYRVKVNGVQVGAYSNFDNAKREADSKNGIVYDMAGNQVYPYNTDATDEKYRYNEKGTFYPNTTINFRNAPKVNADTPIQGQYHSGENVNYDIVVIGERYNWISWISSSTGVRRYMPIRDKVTGEPMWGYAI
jgi:N-acetylmuramoyl-L-alanine amidase